MRNFLALALCASFSLLSHGVSAADPEIYAWIQLGSESKAWVRVLTQGRTCPAVKVDGQELIPAPRRSPNAATFPILSCELPLAGDARRVELGELQLPPPRPRLERIAVIGDTGCRLKRGDLPQSCNDPAAWPFPRLARAVADFKPDLLIHVGDYVYREAACPPEDRGCRGSPHGDVWAAWRADFFVPARELLPAAPWIFVRGNHENCRREGWGWLTFLDPRPLPSECPENTAPYLVTAGARRFAVLDSSAASDAGRNPEEIATFRGQLTRLLAEAKEPFTLLSHRPLWGLQPRAHRPPLWRNRTLATAIQGLDTSRLEQAISGHIHLFEALRFTDGRPPQWVVGNGGTELDPPLPDEAFAETVYAHRDFGFLTFERRGDRWIATLRDREGRPLKEFPDTGFR